MNDPCAFCHEAQDIVNILWVDDDLMGGEEDVIIWASDKLDNRFDCKDLDWVKANGMGLRRTTLGQISARMTNTHTCQCASTSPTV